MYGLLEIHNLHNRYEDLVEEMKRRCYTHYSEVDERWKVVEKAGIINRGINLIELINRCSRCEKRHSKFMDHQFEIS